MSQDPGHSPARPVACISGMVRDVSRPMDISRRDFLRAAAAAGVTASVMPLGRALGAMIPEGTPARPMAARASYASAGPPPSPLTSIPR